MVLGAKRRPLDASSSDSDGAASNTTESERSGDSLEPWSDFLKRTARVVESQLEKVSMEDWITTWRRRQWRWAGKVVQSSEHKWTSAALAWQPPYDCSGCGVRAQARPRKRWGEEFQVFLDARYGGGVENWIDLAKEKGKWKELVEDFVKAG